MATRNLYKGCRGSDVKTLQTQLKSLGYYKTGSVDGIFGSLTDAAVRQFQRAAKITVDGVVGPQTRSALAAAIQKKKTKTKAKKKTTKATKKKTVPASTSTAAKGAKIDPTKPRRAEPSITYTHNKTKRKASVMAEYIEGFTYTDPATGESDTASIDLCNADMAWADKYLPKKGDKFTAKIIAYNWDKAGVNSEFTCGTFCCDDRNFSFPTNSTATINGTSVPEKQAFRSTARSKTWKNITLKEIARRIAKRYKLSLFYQAATIKIKSMEQSQKDDCSFLNQLCSDYGLYIKVYRGKVCIFDAAKYEKKKAIATIDYKDVLSGDYNSTLTGTYTGATIKYTKGTGKSKKECTYKTGSGNRILAITEKVDSLADAKIKAKAKLAAANREAETLRLTVAAAGKELYSAANITLKNAYEMSGKWFIDKATHKINATGGYTIDLELHRVPTTTTTKKTTAKKTTTKTASTKKTTKAVAIKAGDRVTVNGNAYYSGNGGTHNTCKNMTAYVTQVLGGSYKYPYGIAKRKGGARYGWCAKSSLKKS